MNELNKIIKDNSYRSVLNYLRHNPDLRSDLLLLTKHISNNETLENKELLYLYVNKIPQPPLCICGSSLEYVKPNVGYKKTCGSSQCLVITSSKKRKQTNLERYGGNSPSCSSDVVNKMKNTIKTKYGVDNVRDIPGIIEKTINTNLERYGVEWSSQSETIKNKMYTTNIEKYGGICSQVNDEVKNKTINTNLERYGVEHVWESDDIKKKITKQFKITYGGHPMTNEEIKDKTKKTNIEKYGFEYPQQSEVVKNRISSVRTKNWLESMKLMDDNFKHKDGDGYYVLFCEKTNKNYQIHPVTYNRRKRNGEELSIYLNPLEKNYSLGEKELCDYIREIYCGEIIENDRKILNGKEIDIFLPELNIGIEYNGIYFHSSDIKPKNYHQNKFKQSMDNGVELIQIWEDEWYHKKDQIKSLIRHKLKLTENTVYARKCEVREISIEEYRDFIDSNHLQGYSRSKIKIGLFHENGLVSVISFCSPRHKSNNVEYEMIRFCNKLNTNVVGGASKLFKYFVKKYNPTSIVTYSDLDKFNSGLYVNLGFKCVGITEPSLFYSDGKIRHNRFNFRKSKIKEKQIDISKYLKIYNTGNKKYIYTNG